MMIAGFRPRNASARALRVSRHTSASAPRDARRGEPLEREPGAQRGLAGALGDERGTAGEQRPVHRCACAASPRATRPRNTSCPNSLGGWTYGLTWCTASVRPYITYDQRSCEFRGGTATAITQRRADREQDEPRPAVDAFGRSRGTAHAADATSVSTSPASPTTRRAADHDRGLRGDREEERRADHGDARYAAGSTGARQVCDGLGSGFSISNARSST